MKRSAGGCRQVDGWSCKYCKFTLFTWILRSIWEEAFPWWSVYRSSISSLQFTVIAHAVLPAGSFEFCGLTAWKAPVPQAEVVGCKHFLAPMVWRRPVNPATGKASVSVHIYSCARFSRLVNVACQYLVTAVETATHMQRERGKKERKNRKQCFKAQPIWLVLPSCLKNMSLCCPCACKGKQELEREVYQTVYLKLWARVGARRSGNPIRHPLCVHRSLELLPGANDATELLCFQPPPLLTRPCGGTLSSSCWSFVADPGALGRLDQSWRWARRIRDRASIPQQLRGNGALGLLPSCSYVTCTEKAATTKGNTQSTFVDKTYETLITNKVLPSNITNCPAF